MTTPFDPLFFALYYIRMHNVDKCQPIDQTIIDDNFSKAYLIADAMAVDQLALVSQTEKAVNSCLSHSVICVVFVCHFRLPIRKVPNR